MPGRIVRAEESDTKVNVSAGPLLCISSRRTCGSWRQHLRYWRARSTLTSRSTLGGVLVPKLHTRKSSPSHFRIIGALDTLSVRFDFESFVIIITPPCIFWHPVLHCFRSPCICIMYQAVVVTHQLLFDKSQTPSSYYLIFIIPYTDLFSLHPTHLDSFRAHVAPPLIQLGTFLSKTSLSFRHWIDICFRMI